MYIPPLSKSEFMLFLKHPAWLWLKRYRKELLPGVDQALQAIFDNGLEFENMVERIFIDPVKVGFSLNDNSYRLMPEKTMRALKNGARTILQGRVENQGLTCIFDALELNNDDSYTLTEIKSSTSPKDDHYLDLAFQKHILTLCGINISKSKLIYLNKEYIRQGEIDPYKISIIEDVTEKVNEQLSFVASKIQEAQELVKSKVQPNMSPRFAKKTALSEWLQIYETLYPPESDQSIFRLTRLDPEIIGILEDLKIKKIAEIPDDVALNSKQKNQILSVKSKKPIVHKEKIKEFLDNLVFPLYFLDYETYSAIIPPYDKTKPNMNIPFQYSLHILDSEGNLTHKEFLHTTQENPVPYLLSSLKKDIGETGSIISWFKSFESGRNNEMADNFPEYKDFLEDVNLRMVDLMDPFMQDFYIHKDFYGSASIKKVLPVLVADLSYKKLAIQEGGTASRTWGEIVLKGKLQDKKEKVLSDLKKYCFTDTYAMVKIYDHLRTVSD